jgi:hypothetical protein
MDVEVSDGGMKGKSKLMVETNGSTSATEDHILVEGATEATIFLNAYTNYVDYKELAAEAPLPEFSWLERKEYEVLKSDHTTDYNSLFGRFSLDLGTNQRDTLPIDDRIRQFQESEDPQLVALYVQYGRYLLISSSRSGTNPANLQGIWNRELEPAWDSKYTVNINTEMNYWPAEVTNLSECHDNKVHAKGYKNKPLTDEQKASNNEKSKTRARVEHVFGFMEHSMNRLYVRSIGMARANGFVGLVNLTYNLFRYEQIMRLERISVHLYSK